MHTNIHCAYGNSRQPTVVLPRPLPSNRFSSSCVSGTFYRPICAQIAAGQQRAGQTRRAFSFWTERPRERSHGGGGSRPITSQGEGIPGCRSSLHLFFCCSDGPFLKSLFCPSLSSLLCHPPPVGFHPSLCIHLSAPSFPLDCFWFPVSFLTFRLIGFFSGSVVTTRS